MKIVSKDRFLVSLLVFVFILQLANSAAWNPESMLSLLGASGARSKLLSRVSSTIQPFRPVWRTVNLASNSHTSDVDDNVVPPDVNEKRLIEVTSEVKLPFSQEVAFDAYSDLTRQPSWSSWLHSVEYMDESRERSKWTMKFMGIKYSWTAIALRNERPFLIQWQSTTGLQNFGTVKFLSQKDDETHPTLMTMRMAFVAPRAAAAVFRKSKALANFVKDKMITDSMVNFRDAVLRVDMQEPRNQTDC